MIDLAALRAEAESGDSDCIVTRRWLRQVLVELEAARNRDRPAPSLDHPPPPAHRG